MRFRFVRTVLVGVALFGLAACSHDTTLAGAQRSSGPSIVPIPPVIELSPTPDNPFALFMKAADGVLIANPDITPGHATPNLSIPTVCSAGFGVSEHRVGYGDRAHVLTDYGIPWSERTQYQIDYLIPLALGGDDSKDNLWPMPLAGEAAPAMKTALAAQLRTLVCSGKLQLATAQTALASNWWAAYQQYGRPTPIPQEVAHATCSPIGAKAVTDAGKPLVCKATELNTPRWTVVPSPPSASPSPSGSHSPTPSPSR